VDTDRFEGQAVSRLASIIFRGEKVDVEFSDRGYEPDTNGQDIEWAFRDPALNALELTPAEEDEMLAQLAGRSYEDAAED
jgi:hypothetical protein